MGNRLPYEDVGNVASRGLLPNNGMSDPVEAYVRSRVGDMARHVVMFSGGIGSWATARRVAAEHGTSDLTLLFADTRMEDKDLYRFVDEAAANIGAQLVRIAEGRTPWEVFRDKRFLGNTRVDPCSEMLKRKILRRWLEAHRDPSDTVVHIGIDWTEVHRYEAARERWTPWTCEAPLCSPPLVAKQEFLEELRAEGIRPPRLYEMGFPHNNCGGFCVKAGQAHFQLLLKTMPQRYAMHERKERELAEYLGKNVAILRDRRGGKTRPLTLRKLRERIKRGIEVDRYEWGGCGCVA